MTLLYLSTAVIHITTSIDIINVDYNTRLSSCLRQCPAHCKLNCHSACSSFPQVSEPPETHPSGNASIAFHIPLHLAWDFFCWQLIWRCVVLLSGSFITSTVSVGIAQSPIQAGDERLVCRRSNPFGDTPPGLLGVGLTPVGRFFLQ